MEMASSTTSVIPVIQNEYDKYNPWIWIDIETSGLDPKRSEIMEVCIVVTTPDMETWDTLHLIIHHPLSILLTRSSNWCKRHFGSMSYGGNGLFDECNRSNTSYEEAEIKIWHFLEFYSSHPVGTSRPNMNINRRYFDTVSGSNGDSLGNFDMSSTSYPTRRTHRSAMLAGSTVHFDRGFLIKFFPGLKPFLNHKVIDVTSLLEMAKRFRPDLLEHLGKPNGNHRACQDIFDSINLLKYIKENVFDKVC